MTTTTIVDVNRDDLEMAPDNVRHEMDWEQLEGLAQSIAEVGLLQPIVVQPPGEDGIRRIVHGARRMAAIDLITTQPDKYPTTRDFDVISCIEAVYDSDGDRLTAMLIENLQREDISPVAEAQAYARLVDELGWQQVDIAKRVGRNKGHITKRLQLLALPPEVLWFIEEGDITLEQAAHLVKLADHPEIILKIVGEHGRYNHYEVDAALGKLDIQRKCRIFAERVAQHTGLPIVRTGGPVKAPKGTGHPFAPLGKPVKQSEWDGTVPGPTVYLRVAMETWDSEPSLTFFTDQPDHIDTANMSYDQRQKYEQKVKALAVTERTADPEAAADVEAAHLERQREGFIEASIRRQGQDWVKHGLRLLARKPTVDQLLTLVHLDCDELFDNADPATVAEMLTVPEDHADRTYEELHNTLAEWANTSTANRRRLSFAVLLEEYGRTETVIAMIAKAQGAFDEDKARLAAEAELNGQGDDPDDE